MINAVGVMDDDVMGVGDIINVDGTFGFHTPLS